jgi:hypothetical protein
MTKLDYTEFTDFATRTKATIFSNVDTVCCGKSFRIYQETGQCCDVSGYHESLPSLEAVPIATCVTAYNHANGNTYTLAFGELLFFGDSMEHSLICPVQVQSNDLIVDTWMHEAVQ